MATRKNPHAIAVDLEPGTQVSCWYTMWMAISTTAACEIYAQCVSTV